MKSNVILAWIVNDAINGEHLGIVDVPEEGEHEWEQNEGWWTDYFGNCPPHNVPAGSYLYYYQSQVSGWVYDGHASVRPDVEIEFPDDSVYLYRMDEMPC